MLASAMQAMHLTLPSLAVHAQLVVQVRIRLLQAIRRACHARQTALGAEVRVLASATVGSVLLMMASHAQIVFRAHTNQIWVMQYARHAGHTALHAEV